MDKLPAGHYRNIIDAVNELEQAHKAQQEHIGKTIDETAKQRHERYQKREQDNKLITPAVQHGS